MIVSAIMPTRGRPDFAQAALRCFVEQTWVEKELIVLDDAKQPSFPDGLALDDGSVQYHRVAGLEIGAKRNICCARASGDIIMHWDDDDYSNPFRMGDQVWRLAQSGKAVTGYCSMRFTDGPRAWLFSRPDFALGTSLCYRRDWWEQHPFPAVQVGEDGAFVDAAKAAKQLVVADAGDLMHATIHAGNTSPRQLSGSNWKEL
jgi:glycosyltransferase involved in cell wall biosynthesis